MALNVTKITQISPLSDSSRENPFILPLTFFDLRWLHFHPNEQVIFYQLSESSRDSFYSLILPKLEQSLSVVLGYYLPLAGHLTWNPQDPKPCIVVLPNDTVSLIVAESSGADFSSVAGKGLRPAKEIRPLVPELPVSAYEYAADFRHRLGPSVTGTYSGACVFTTSCLGYKAKHFLGEDGFINAVEMISDSVKGLGSRGIEVLFDLFVDRMKNIEPGTDIWAASGSNRFSVYGSDFGWGRPVNREIVSYDQCQIFSMSEMRDQTGGVEIGLCLKKSEMDVLISLFKSGFETKINGF